MLFFLLLNFEAFQAQKIQKTEFHISLEVINSEIQRKKHFYGINQDTNICNVRINQKGILSIRI